MFLHQSICSLVLLSAWGVASGQFVTGMANIRDVMLLPRLPGNAGF